MQYLWFSLIPREVGVLYHYWLRLTYPVITVLILYPGWSHCIATTLDIENQRIRMSQSTKRKAILTGGLGTFTTDSIRSATFLRLIRHIYHISDTLISALFCFNVLLDQSAHWISLEMLLVSLEYSEVTHSSLNPITQKAREKRQLNPPHRHHTCFYQTRTDQDNFSVRKLGTNF